MGSLIARRRRDPAAGPRREQRSGVASAQPVSGSFECRLETGELRCSSGLRRILACAPDLELSAPALLERVHPEDQPTLGHALRRARQGNAPFSLELRIVRFDEVPRTVRLRGIRLDDEADAPGKLIGTIQDVTEEIAARSSDELLRFVVDSAGEAIFTAAPDGIITSWNRAAEQLYGYSPQEALGSRHSLGEPPHCSGEQEQVLRRVLAGEVVDELVTERLRKDGTPIQVSLNVSPVHDPSGTIVAAAVAARDLKPHPGFENRLRHLADHDQLTGLFNRRRFDEELRRELARAARSDRRGALMVIDVDGFKTVNDGAGHAAGDTVLAHVAGVIRGRLRNTDVLGRLGGDEFGALLPDAVAMDARTTAEDLRRAINASPPEFDGRPVRITTSIGVAPFSGDEVTPDELLIHGDLAMYAARAAGRDRVVVYSPKEGRRARSRAREPWSERIREALESDAFVLHLQPIIDLSTGRVSHGELLLRMRDAEGRLIAPGAFLPTAERVGLIHQIDRWVVKRAIELIASFPADELAPVSVNLSGDTVVSDSEMLALIRGELERTAADPARLIFEVTETVAIVNMPDALGFTRGLIGLGCSLALDDFGTGFASFKYLKHLPVRFIKLDGEFIQNLPKSPVDEHLVRTIVALAQSLGIKTVAEAVGDDETLHLLRAHAVDFAQGFHLGTPEPLPEHA